MSLNLFHLMLTDNRFSSKLVSQKKLKYLFECAGKMQDSLVGSVEVLGSAPLSPSQSLCFCSHFQGLCLTTNVIFWFSLLIQAQICWELMCGNTARAVTVEMLFCKVSLPQDCWLLLLLEQSKKWDGFKSLLVLNTDYWGIKQSWNLNSTSVLWASPIREILLG